MRKLCLLLALSLFYSPALFAAPPQMASLFGGPFTLINQDQQTVTQDDFRGKFMLINFGYTYCPDICPTSLSTMASALDELGTASAIVQPIFITIDPERDTPAVLKPYVSVFHPRMIGLSGDNKQIAQIAKAYRVHRSKVFEANKPTEDYLVNHSSLTYLMDKNGGFLTIFPHGTQPDVMAKAIQKYLN